ncbi:MAG: NADH:flavin oxidoreductase [Firmicutes bacterium]|nr:NADH:flavin oxidoreductase [Bacillota bacterium]
MNTKFGFMLQPWTIRKTTLPNRIMFPAWQLNWANADGTISEKLYRFYEQLSLGKCGIITIGGCNVSYSSFSRIHPRMIKLEEDKYIDGLKKACDLILENGSIPSVQLAHLGRQGTRQKEDPILIAPSPIESKIMRLINPDYQIREMNQDDIKRVKEDFVNAAGRVKKAGAPMLEILAGMGYLLAEFLSPETNKRTDQYGGNVENRVRFIAEIITDIRSIVGEEMIISLRVSGNEFSKEGLVPADFKEILPLLENTGYDILNISVGMLGSFSRVAPIAKEPPYIYISEEFSKYTGKVRCICGAIRTPWQANEIIKNNQAELVAIGRGLIADKNFVKKTLEGQEDKINFCIQCNKCADVMNKKEFGICEVY